MAKLASKRPEASVWPWAAKGAKPTGGVGGIDFASLSSTRERSPTQLAAMTEEVHTTAWPTLSPPTTSGRHHRFLLPGRTKNDEGKVRRVGFELEFSGPSVEVVSNIVINEFGGRVETDGRFTQRVVGTDWGTFRVEVDSAVLKDARYLDLLWSSAIPRDKSAVARMMESGLEHVIKGMASQFVPCEIVTPPFPIDRLAPLESLRRRLMRRHAESTRAAIHRAFGLHINAEVPSFAVGDLLNHLRAFLLLYDWLVEAGQVDFTRRLTPYVEDFPEVYRRLVLDPSYNPVFSRFRDDYLVANPTRNRPLDLTPLLALLDEDAVNERVQDAHLVSPRPTFHYRLPNCQVDEPRWSIAEEWNRWVLVERLANASHSLERLMLAYLQLSPTPMNLHRRHWLDGMSRWLEEAGWDYE
jgi:Putative amidoligase enzyme